MSPYEKFKKDHRVTSLSKEELFNLAFEQGLQQSDRVDKAEALLKQVADKLSQMYTGGGAPAEAAKKLLRPIYAYKPSLVTCDYTRRYVNS
jgi:hypothetical protein